MRASAVLLPIFSINSKYGIGGFSKEAYEVVDFLERAGQKYWQILPLGPTSYGDSPYQSLSTYAGNPYFIDLEQLIEEGLLSKEEVEEVDFGQGDSIDYGKLYEGRLPLLRKAYERSRCYEDPEFISFREKNGYWLRDYALFMALKNFFKGESWQNWPEDIRLRWGYAMDYYNRELYYDIEALEYIQYKFLQQWKKLKSYANEKGIKIIGDIPIYAAGDSADIWANPHLFLLDGDSNPRAVSGYPPDGFSEEGQLWGNPLYDWQVNKNTGYRWWIERLSYCFELYDVVRIDHFKGFDEYYSIPYGDKNAVRGHWEQGPGMDIFYAIKGALGDKPIIVEDLGQPSESCDRLLKDCGYPGMKVMQFAFDLNDSKKENPYLPHNHIQNSVVYTGTHDHDTLWGWVQKLSNKEISYIKDYLNIKRSSNRDMAKELIRVVHSSVANLAVVPIQDYLGLGNEAKINGPGTLGGNWQWRLKEGMLTEALAEEILTLTRRYGR